MNGFFSGLYLIQELHAALIFLVMEADDCISVKMKA